MKSDSILCIGEILWDRMPEGNFLGGAPFNVAYHLSKFGWSVKFISRVGADDLGAEAIRRVENLGISAEYIQIDENKSTGVVDVTFGSGGVPRYIIKEPAAWDAIESDEKTEKIIRDSAAIVFGTLAQRNDISKQTIQSIRSSQALKVLDLNVRAPFDHIDIVRESLEIADFLKINDDELTKLQEWFSIPGTMREAASSLAKQFNLKVICITCGADGASLLQGAEWIESEGVKISPTDTVGAGDAFLAVLITGYMEGRPMNKVLDYANRFGAYIATQKGGTPPYNINHIDQIHRLHLAVI